MDKIKFWQLVIRLGVLLGMAGLLVLALQPDLPVHAEEAARQPFQDNYPAPNPTDGYAPPPGNTPVTTQNPYPAGPTNPTETPPGSVTQPPVNTLQPSVTVPPGTTVTQPAFGTQPPQDETPFPTPNLSQTAELDAFRTEDAEMSGSRNGTPTTPTPEGTQTPTPTPSASPTEGEVYRAAGVEPGEGDSGGFQMNWGLFWIGFSIPVVGACGVVLYLLDRRPEFFRPKRNQRSPQ